MSGGFSLNLTVCAMLVTKRGKGDEIPEMTEEDMKKGFKSWSGYYFSNQLYCVDEDMDKREFFWNIKKLVSVPACPVDYNDYKMNASSTFTTNIHETAKNNTTKKSSIKDGVVLNVEGLNNEAYESSTDNLENGHHLQSERNKLEIDNEKCEMSEDNSNNPHYLQFEIPETKTNDETYEISKDNSENPHYLQFEIPETKTNEATDETSKGNCANGHCVEFEILKTKTNDETYEMSKDNSENPHYLQFEMPKTAINEDISEMSKDNSENGNYLQFEVPNPKLNPNEVKKKTEDITNNKETDQNGTNAKSGNSNSKKIRIKSKKENKVKKSVKEKLKLLYTNVSFVLLLISLSMFLFGTSVVFTHILPYAESEKVSSSIGLLLVSVIGGAALVGRIALGAIAQLP